MNGRWIAGSVRAQLLVAERSAGPGAARELAASGSLAEALVRLGRSPQRRAATVADDLAGAQRAVADVTLLDLRVLAGWLPADALGLLRSLAAWYELANIEDRIAYLGGAALRRPFELGALAVAWPRAAEAQTVDELRRALAAGAWGDPDGVTPADLGLGLRLAWARRVAAEAPEARSWAAGAVALLLARELYVGGVPVELLPAPAVPLLGSAWPAAATLTRFAEALPPAAGWALAGVESADDLWRAEGRWWSRVASEARAMLQGSAPGRRVVVAAVALLGVDAHRIMAALAAAHRSDLPGAREAFDAAA